MPRSLAAGHTKLAIFATKPSGDLAALPVSAFTGPGVIDAACRVAMADFSLGAVDSETFTDQALCEEVAAETPGSSKYEGNITPFRYFDSEGKAEVGVAGEIGDALFQAVKEKGTTLWIGRRDTSKKSKEDWGQGEEYKLFEVITDEPKESSQEGYIKHPVKLFVQSVTRGVVAA